MIFGQPWLKAYLFSRKRRRMRSKSRYPRIGDVLVVDDIFRGMVSRVTKDKWGHHDSAFVVWQTRQSPDYSRKYGYSSVNIHNLRGNYRLFRDGEEIL